MKHINFNDYLNFKTLNITLPCNCKECLEKISIWEKEREKIVNFEEKVIFKRQEKKLIEKIEKKVFPYKTILAFGFTLILLTGFLYLINIQKKNKIENYDLEYSKIQEIYENPPLGDLEACSIIFEGSNNEKEEK